MKNLIKYISFAIAGVFGLLSCETYDVVDEIAQPGHYAANVYIEVPSGNVNAGDSVDFTVEYWTIGDEFTDLGLWYSLDINLNYELTSVYNQDYSFSLDSTKLVREFHEVNAYEHSVQNYDEEKEAYVIEDGFPVSYTLAATEINSPDTYNESQINSLFPSSVFQRFYEGLFETLGYDVLKEILVTDFEMIDEVTFDSYFTEIEVEQPPVEEGEEQPEPEYIYEMNEDAGPVLLNLLKEVSVEDLVYNELVPEYGIKFSREYKVNAKFRVVNGNGIENFSDVKTVSVK